jgi:hypothetical protein
MGTFLEDLDVKNGIGAPGSFSGHSVERPVADPIMASI